MKKIDDPVLMDANILMKFKGQLEYLFQFFSEILIHYQVKKEVLDQTLLEELREIESKFNIKYVNDIIINDEISQVLFNECDKELKTSFNIKAKKDLGEYKSLLYAKFNSITFFSSQDTTVWTFVNKSKYFKGIKCITIQDLAYYMYSNAFDKNNKRVAKGLYKAVTKEEHEFDYFKKYMENNNEIVGYIDFENERLANYEQLLTGGVEQYKEIYYGGTYCDVDEIEKQLCKMALAGPNLCTSCLFSRISNAIDFSQRICSLGLGVNDKKCIENRQEFKMKIKKRVKE